jgi:hypothetical protein
VRGGGGGARDVERDLLGARLLIGMGVLELRKPFVDLALAHDSRFFLKERSTLLGSGSRKKYDFLLFTIRKKFVNSGEHLLSLSLRP